MKGSDCNPKSLPIHGKHIRKIPHSERNCLTPEEAQTVYDCLETEQVVSPIHFNKEIAKTPNPRKLAYQKLEEILEEEGSVNPYQIMFMGPDEHIKNKDPFLHIDIYQPGPSSLYCMNTQNMENWSVLSTEMHYADPPQGHHNLMAMDCKTTLLTEWDKSGKAPTITPANTPHSDLLDHCLDQFDSISTKINNTGEFQDNRDVSTTYLGTDVISKKDHFTPEVKFPITSTSHTWGQLVGGSTMSILLDTGASKCYMSRAYFERNKLLHNLPRLKSTIKSLRVGNGNEVSAHFVIPVLLKIAGHKFEIYALVSDIQPSIDLVLGMKNMHEIEGELSPRNSEFRFLNRAVPLFTMENFSLKPGCKRFVKCIAPFPTTLTGQAIIKIVQGLRTITVQCKIHNNLAVLDLVNTSKTTMLFSTDSALGIVDIRSLGFYNIKHATLQYNLSKQFPQYNKIADDHAEQIKTKHVPKQGSHVEHVSQQKLQQSADDPYPWLDSQDPRRDMSDEEILRKYIDLSQSILNDSEKEELMQIILNHKSAFSLRDEFGECPNIKIDIDVIDESPFFVRPFPISEEDKPIMDKQMQRLCSLKILSRNTTSHTSPVMLITRKVTKDKRPVVDFRLLNTRIKRHNTATPLLRDIYQMLGKAQSTVLSCVDLKDAFHSLKLTEKAKDYCGILPYFGSPHYRYEVMPMGLSISPCKWIQYIGYVMEKMPHPENYIAIMDDLLVHSRESEHMVRILDMLKALVEHGLKLSPKKCQFFRNELVYMGNTFKTGPTGITITPIKTRTEAILDTPAPTTAKDCKSFCGVVNYVSLFCPHLQKLLAPIYDLTRKGRPFVWTKSHQENFDKIKKQMASPPVLTLPTSTGRYILYSDTSKLHAGSALWQIQNGKPRLVGYASKSLPKACANYGITELEMTGLLYNMLQWKYWLGKKDFDAAVDHRAIPYILKAKHLPTTDRITRLLEGLNQFTFHLYYVKGKDMILCDFVSRVAADDSDPMDLIPISFNVYELLQDHYSSIEAFNVMTRKARAQAGLAPPPSVHGAVKGVNPNLKPETQAHRSGKPVAKFKTPVKASPKALLVLTPKSSPSPSSVASTPDKFFTPKSTPIKTPHDDLRARLKRALQENRSLSNLSKDNDKHPTTNPGLHPLRLQFRDKQPSKLAPNPSSSIPTSQLKPMPIHLVPQLEGQLMQPHEMETAPEIDPNMEIPLHETSVDAMFRAPEMKDFSLPPTLSESLKGKTILAQTLPRQSEIDKLLRQLNRIILTQTRFPTSLKDLEAAYCNSSAFKDVFQYLRYNKLPSNKRLAKQVQISAQDYYVIGSILFKYLPLKSGELDSVMCIPPSKMDCILDYYHSVIGGHMGMTKTLKTLSTRYFCPRMADYIRAYIIGCHLCQLFKNSKRFHRPFMKRQYDISQAGLVNVSMDIKYMPRSNKGYKFLLVILCEITNFLVTHPMKEISAEQVCSILVDEFICYFSTPVRIVCDQDPSFMSTLCQYCFQQYKIQLITVGVTNHKSLQAEHGIKSLGNLIITHLTGLGNDWHIYAKPCMLTYNSFNSPNLDSYCPFE